MCYESSALDAAKNPHHSHLIIIVVLTIDYICRKIQIVNTIVFVMCRMIIAENMP